MRFLFWEIKWIGWKNRDRDWQRLALLAVDSVIAGRDDVTHLKILAIQAKRVAYPGLRLKDAYDDVSSFIATKLPGGSD